MNLIVNLLSDQSIPSIQFIKEFYKPENDDKLLFIATKLMMSKGILANIYKASNIDDERTKNNMVIEVEPHSLKSVKYQLEKLDLELYDDIFVNITGGTKIMSIATYDFFKNNGGAKIYYIPGHQFEYNLVFPERKENILHFNKSISLEEYFLGYGFAVRKSSPSGITAEYTKRFFKWFVNRKSDEDYIIISEIQKYRGKSLIVDKIEGLANLLNNIDFPRNKEDKLVPKEVDYLVGNWFEEYIYFKIKEHFKMRDEDITAGLNIFKKDIQNELDVVFMKDSKLYIIECKTYIMSKQKGSLPNDTIYKSTALNKQMGLFAKSFIYTLNKSTELKENHIDRASLYDTKIMTVENIMNDEFLNLL